MYKIRGRNIGKNPEKSLKSFHHCYSQSPTALPWDFCLFKLSQPLKVSTVQLLYTVKDNGGKPDKKTTPPSFWFKKSTQKPQVWELSRLCPEISTKLYVHEFCFWTDEKTRRLKGLAWNGRLETSARGPEKDTEGSGIIIMRLSCIELLKLSYCVEHLLWSLDLIELCKH
jgi:hypothetical protein